MADQPAPLEAAAEAPAAAPVSRSKDPNRPLTFRYWTRPTNLQYKYLYDFRHNYYNDVIDYLDRRSRGLTREIPKPQTWAERALRTSFNPKSEMEARRQKDVQLLSSIRTSSYNYHYHVRDSMSRRFEEVDWIPEQGEKWTTICIRHESATPLFDLLFHPEEVYI